MATPGFILLQGDPTTWTPPDVGKTALGINASGQVVTMQHDGSITVLVSSSPATGSQTSSSGTVTVTPSQPIFTEIVTLLGAARAVPIAIPVAGALSGSRVTIQVQMPALAGLNLTFYNNNTSGTALDTFSTDGSIRTGVWDFYFDGAAWQLLRSQIPAY
jgi:hypothetical protein